MASSSLCIILMWNDVLPTFDTSMGLDRKFDDMSHTSGMPLLSGTSLNSMPVPKIIVVKQKLSSNSRDENVIQHNCDTIWSIEAKVIFFRIELLIRSSVQNHTWHCHLLAFITQVKHNVEIYNFAQTYKNTSWIMSEKLKCHYTWPFLNVTKYACCVQGWTLAPVRPPAAGNFGVRQVHSAKYTSGWRVTFLTNWSVDSNCKIECNVDVSLKT